MAKQKRGIIKLSGKIGDMVHVEGRNGNYVRELAAQDGEKSAGFNNSKNLTYYINKLASELNRIIPHYAEHLHRPSFYKRLSTKFREEEVYNRFLMLRRLIGLEIHPDYPLAKQGEFDCIVARTAKGIQVDLTVKHHPFQLTDIADSYYYQVILLCWNKSDKSAVHARQLSDWIETDGPLPAFEFSFAGAKDPTHWLLCVRIITGNGKQRIERIANDGMQITDVGSFDAGEIALLEEKEEEEKLSIKRKLTIVEEPRVKAKSFS